MYKTLLCIVLPGVLILSCKKESGPAPVTPQPEVTTTMKNMIPWAEGNYWVYELYREDSLGNVVNTQTTIDSLCIAETTGSDTTLSFRLYRGTPGKMVLSDPIFYPLNMMADSGNYYRVLGEVINYRVPKSALPFALPDFYRTYLGDTLYVAKQTLQHVPSPLPGNTGQAVMLEMVFPVSYVILQKCVYRYIWIQGTGLYQFQVSSAPNPYPNQSWRLLRYHVH